MQTPALVVITILLVLAAYALGDRRGGEPVRLYADEGLGEPVWHRGDVPLDRWVGLVLTEQAWETLPAQTGRVRPPGGDAEPDFSEVVVVAAYMGAMPTGGHSIAVREVTYTPGDAAAAGRVTIRLFVGSPGPGEMVTQAFTHPGTSVEIPRAEWPEGVLEQVASGNVLVEALDQDGRDWGPVLVLAD